MNFKEIQEEMNTINDRKKALIDAAKAEGIKGLFKPFFDENPDVKALAFCGYTPSFNDGDPCLFSIRQAYRATSEADLSDLENLSVNDLDESDGWVSLDRSFHYVRNPDPEGSYWLEDENGNYVKAPVEGFSQDAVDLWVFLQRNDDLTQGLFGEDFEVFITPEEAIVSEYDCGY